MHFSISARRFCSCYLSYLISYFIPFTSQVAQRQSFFFFFFACRYSLCNTGANFTKQTETTFDSPRAVLLRTPCSAFSPLLIEKSLSSRENRSRCAQVAHFFFFLFFFSRNSSNYVCRALSSERGRIDVWLWVPSITAELETRAGKAGGENNK